MKITDLTIRNFLRVAECEMDFTPTPVHLICGLNESGKSTVYEAIRYALMGETVRVARKSDYKLMVRAGSKTGTVSVGTDLGRSTIDVATGKAKASLTNPLDPAVEFILDSTRYAWATPEKRRSTLFNVLSVKIDRDDVASRLAKRDVPEGYIEQVLPLLRSGFESAHKEAKRKASESRGGWKAITGETYGSNKADGWQPVVEKPDETAVNKLLTVVEKVDADLAGVTERLGALKSAPQGLVFNCPSCEATLSVDRGQVKYHEEGRNAAPSPREYDDLTTTAASLRDDRMQALGRLRDAEQQAEKYASASSDAVKASVLHTEVAMWSKLADELSMEGIPAEIISDKIAPINNRLRQTSLTTGWSQVQITPSMEILVGGLQYGLASESAQWRAQAAIAEAISHAASLHMLVLDRMDVLDVPSRTQLLKWVQVLAEKGGYQTILLFATLKSQPTRLPPAITAHWLQGGELVARVAA